jgi:hypothetical protein
MDGGYGRLVAEISDRFGEALELANHSAGPNDDRAIVMAIEALAGAVLLVADAIHDRANPQATDDSP